MNDSRSLIADGDLLWIQSRYGVIRLDTRAWECTVFTGVGTGFLHSLLPDGQGGLWIGSRQGLGRISDGRRRMVLPARFFRQHPPANLRLGWDGNLCVGLHEAFSFVMDVDTLKVIEAHLPDGEPVITDLFAQSNNCARWQRASGWSDSSSSYLNYATRAGCEQIAEQLASNDLQPRALIAVSADGEETWVVEKTSSETVRLTRQWGGMVQEANVPYQHVAALALGHDAWMILGERLVRVHTRAPFQDDEAAAFAVQPFSLRVDAFPGDVRSLVEDQAGGVWAINGYGALRYDELEQNWSRVISATRSADAIAADPDQGVWVAGRGELLRATQAQQQSWPLPDVITGTPTALLVGQNHRLWLGTLQDGIWTTLVPSMAEAWDEPVALDWRQFGSEHGLADELITVLSYGPDGRMYAGHHAGVSMFAPTNGDLVPTDGDFAPTDGDFAPTDGDFAPTDGDFAPTDRMELGRWTTLPGSDAPDGKGWVNALAWKGEQLWVGYFNDLALRSYADGLWTDHVCPADMLGIGALLVDDDGVLWVGTTEGLWRWPAASKGSESFCRMLEPDSIAVRETLTLFQDAEGRIWAGGREGVSMLESVAKMPTATPTYTSRLTPTPTSTSTPTLRAEPQDKTITPYPTVMPDWPAVTPTPVAPLDDWDFSVPDAGSAWRRQWRYEDSPSRVNALLRDGEWLWVAMPEGLVHLNLRTLAFTRLEYAGAESDFSLAQMRALLRDPQGCLWASSGGYKGSARYCANPSGIGGDWQIVPDASGFQMAVDAGGNLRTYYYGGGHGRDVLILLCTGYQPPLGKGESIYSLYSELPPASDCAHWFSTSSNQGQLDPYQSSAECQKLAAWRERLASQFGPGYMESVSLALDGDAVWFFRQRGRVTEFKQYDLLRLDDEGRLLTVPWNFAPPGPKTLLAADVVRTGVWIGTPDGLFFSDGQSVQKMPLHPADLVTTRPIVLELARDSKGGLWAATEGGLFRLDEETDVWQSTGVNRTVRITPDKAGGLWTVPRLPMSWGTVEHFDGNNWQEHPWHLGWPCAPKDIVADGDGGLWLIASDCAFQRFDGQQWTRAIDIHGNWLLRDSTGGVYAGQGDNQIYHYDQAQGLRALPLPQDHSRTYIEDVVLDPGGNLWMAYRDYPYLLHLPPCESLVPSEDCEGWQWRQSIDPVTEPVYALLVDSRGNLWAGGKHALLRYDGARWERIPALNTTRLDIIKALAEDRQGRIWAAGLGGFYVYDPTGE